MARSAKKIAAVAVIWAERFEVIGKPKNATTGALIPHFKGTPFTLISLKKYKLYATQPFGLEHEALTFMSPVGVQNSINTINPLVLKDRRSEATP